PTAYPSEYNQVKKYAAHHEIFSDGYWGTIGYAVVDMSPDFNLLTSMSAHETDEAATDVDTTSGYRDSSGNEIGDKCADHTFYMDGYLVQEVWSNISCACIQTVPTTPPPPPPDPCDKLPVEERACCHKPWLPMCNPRGR